MRRLWHHPARRLGMQLGVDALGLGLAYHLAFFLRFNMDPAPRYIDMSLQTLPMVVLSTLFCLVLLRIYKVMWRYLSLTDLVQLAKALLAGTLVATVVLALWTRLEMYPRTVLPIYVLLGVCLLSSTRMIGRSWFERGMKLRRGNPNAKRVLLIGAGRAAEMLLNELRANRESDMHVVGLLDDDPVKRNRLILGAPVLGRIEELPETLRDQNIERIVFCIPSAANSLRLSLLESCSDLGVTLETLPRIADLAAGKVTVTQIREVTLEDLLGRDPVALDERAVAQFLNGKVVMITGAGGSIGSEICRQVINYGPSAVLLFERSELALFTIDGQLRRLHPGTTIIPLLGDIQNALRVDEVLKTYAPQVVFHAAAYKHVPLVEQNPYEALANNVGGSLVVAKACAEYGVEAFVLISTDKAVNPTSFMGATKRIAERVAQAVGGQSSNTRFTTVRFGNVIGSSGSVIPTFREQILRGGPITVTHKDIERFFMTAPEAAQLVLQAGTLSEGDDTFILEMGEPVRIVHLARQLIRLSGLKEGDDIDIVFSGLRPGEKLFEELIINGENQTRTAHQKILRVSRKEQDHEALLSAVAELLETGHARQASIMRDQACELVDNYQPTQLPRPKPSRS